MNTIIIGATAMVVVNVLPTNFWGIAAGSGIVYFVAKMVGGV